MKPNVLHNEAWCPKKWCLKKKQTKQKLSTIVQDQEKGNSLFKQNHCQIWYFKVPKWSRHALACIFFVPNGRFVALKVTFFFWMVSQWRKFIWGSCTLRRLRGEVGCVPRAHADWVSLGLARQLLAETCRHFTFYCCGKLPLTSTSWS